MTAPLARVVHSIPGRARLRATGIKGDRAALGGLQAALEDVPAVKNVHVSLTTGSLVVEHEGSIDDVLRPLEASGAIELGQLVAEPWLTQLNRALAESDRRIQRASKGKLNLETVSFVGFLAGGAYQVLNGHALPAGVTLLRYAVELVTATAIVQVRQAAAHLPPSESAPP